MTHEYSEKKTRSKAVKAILKNTLNSMQDPDFVRKVADEFMQSKIAQFPKICAMTRKDNMLKKKEFDIVGNSGGWSKRKNFKFDYSIPKELYLFMTNMVSREFWDEANEKIWRWFMQQIMKGEESSSLLYRCKQKFEGTAESKKIKVK